MLGWVGQWVKTLVIIVLVGNLAEFLLPKGDLKRYTGLVVGLVLLLAMVSPLTMIWHKLPVSVPSLAATGPATGPWQETVLKEELQQAQAMVLALPGVRSCLMTPTGSGEVRVRVTVSRSDSTTKSIPSYVKAAVHVATASQMPVQVTVVSPRD